MADYEVIARRHTYDGQLVQIWSDGALTVGPESGNRIVARRMSRMVAWLVAGDVSVFTASELPGLVKAARKAVDMHEREPHRVLERDLRRIMLAYAPNGG